MSVAGLHKLFFVWKMSNKYLTNVQAIGSRYLCNKNSDKMSAFCILFFRLIDCEMFDQVFNSGSKMLGKLFAMTSNFFEN
jgi:hypothetical protein